jgi:hypothetical protein
MSGVTYYAGGKVARLRTLPQIIEAETKNGIRRGLNRLRKATADEFRSRGVGRSIFAKGYKKGALKTILAREKVKKVGETYQVGLRIKGIAAIVGLGDKTASHDIGADRKVLSNRGGGFFAVGRVKHPGSRFQRDDFPGRALSRTGGEFRSEVSKGLAKVAARING